jgi:4-amino-4-deoxy-L-arabinose transferase-like glycosyltransferase
MNTLPRWAALVFLATAGLLYASHLDRSPVYLNSDETMFAVQAHSIATTGRDIHGRLLPVYFQMNENVWYHPSVVYAMAPFVRFAAPSPLTIRLPTVLIALLTLALVHKLARAVGVQGYAALAAPVFLALTPAYFMHSRLACDYLFPVPFVLTWMIFLVDYLRTQRTRVLVAATAALGFGFYTYIAAVVLMPLYVGVTLAALMVQRRRQSTALLIVVGTFAICLLPSALWLWTHPGIVETFVTRYDEPNATALGPTGLVLVDTLLTRLRVYVSFFEPSFLFEVARASVMSSTYTTGVFLAGGKILMPLGVYHMLRHRRSPAVYLVLIALLAAPAAASLVDEPYAIDRSLGLLPLGAIVAAFGVEWLLERRSLSATVVRRSVLALTAIWMLVQFDGFHRDYFTDYRRRAAFWFNNNHPGALDPIISDHPPGDLRPIYLSDRMPFIRFHWALQLLQHERSDLLDRTVYFDADHLNVEGLPVGTTLLTNADAADQRFLLGTGRFRVLADVSDLDGALMFTRLIKEK